MMSSYISTLSWTNTALNTLPKLQSDISKVNTEIATGRHADVGLTLGITTGRSVDLHIKETAVQSLIDGNALTTNQLSLTQNALTDVADTANSFLQNLMSVPDTSGGAASLEAHGKTSMSALTATLNTSDGKRFIFAGVNSAVKPVADYGSTPKTALNAVFAAKFGLDPTDPQNDPKIANIAPADMSSFLDTEFASLFADPAWGASWSSASSENLTSRISQTERATVSTNANTQPMRDLAKAYAMVGELGIGRMSASTLQVVLDKARIIVGAAVSGVTDTQAALGVTEQRVATSNESMIRVVGATQAQISALEGVDPAEAKTRMDTLTTQLQMSYATTAKLMQLSILNYV
ncbi:flagellar hook-associated family protein [Roseixanthobacter glucoisosaccharinicivorans]|uniref:flagellar hook-associated family protein n=1 Tax=Roseixanthobacter glucoisosaccharinicivorans TaxID=3119923 RepID=UPI00372B586E